MATRRITKAAEIKMFVDLGWELRIGNGKAALFWPSETQPEIERVCSKAAAEAIGFYDIPFQALILGPDSDPGI